MAKTYYDFGARMEQVLQSKMEHQQKLARCKMFR